jgi:O-antigen/teichoic acid export membrane protein
MRDNSDASVNSTTPIRDQRIGNVTVDPAVAWGMLRVGVAGVVTLVTIVLVAHGFTPRIQGYHYTFLSLAALQVFAEMGLGQVITQFASHEWARLRFDETGGIAGDPDARSRLAGLARFAFRWYAVGGALLGVLMAVAGTVYFSRTADDGVAWRGPWLLLCAGIGARLCLLPAWALLEGCHQVAAAHRYRVLETAAGSFALWVGIVGGAGLWATAAGLGAGALAAVAATVARRRSFFRSLRAAPAGPRLDWRAEIWPMQWRIALSWLAGYLAFSTFTPILFHVRGPEMAGRLGMTWNLIAALTSVAAAWGVARAPAFGGLIAEARFRELDRQLARLLAATILTAVLGAGAIGGAVLALQDLHPGLAARLLDPLPTALFLLGAVVNVSTYPLSVYLRAHKREPYVIPSAISGIAIVLGSLLLAPRYGAAGMAAGYLATVAVMTPVAVWIWHRCRREWHPAPGPDPVPDP